MKFVRQFLWTREQVSTHCVARSIIDLELAVEDLVLVLFIEVLDLETHLLEYLACYAKIIREENELVRGEVKFVAKAAWTSGLRVESHLHLVFFLVQCKQTLLLFEVEEDLAFIEAKEAW